MKIQKYVLKNRVREERLKLGLTQQELANEIGVSRNTINTIEHGDVDMRLPLAMKLCLFFKKPYKEMFRMERKNEL